jgi:hypothetical protein
MCLTFLDTSVLAFVDAFVQCKDTQEGISRQCIAVLSEIRAVLLSEGIHTLLRYATLRMSQMFDV